MKFRGELGYYQNRVAWQKHYLTALRTNYDTLNTDEKEWLRSLNERLRQLEKQYLPIMEAKRQELQARVADPSDWMNDFNLDFLITFFLREDDPEYEEDDDSILMQIVEGFYSDCPPDPEWGFGATNVDHAERLKADSFTGELHCYLYHQLSQHSRLDWRDLFRIGNLYLEIKIEEQSDLLPVNPFR